MGKQTISKNHSDALVTGKIRAAQERRAKLMEEANTKLPPGCRFIPLTQGAVAKVDASDFERLSKWSWRLFNNHTGYAVRWSRKTEGDRRIILMHRWILNAPESSEVDHINHDTLDNRRCNLRLAQRHGNLGNAVKQPKRKTSSRFKGVSLNKASGRFRAQCCGIYLGSHESEVSAAKAYNSQAVKSFGEFALTNKV